tara:strand:- start:88 stop:747 length:660 start_codon:yes stop_codon:yes gene_type:complete
LNSRDIKPVRSESSDNRKKRSIGGSSILFASLLGLINLGGLLVLGLWFFNASGYQQETGQNFVERLSVLEEEINSVKNLNKESFASTEEEVKFINKEIRKLWDLSNKRNRKNIDSLKLQLTEIESLTEYLSKTNNSILAKQRAINLELAKLEKSQSDLNTKLSRDNSSLSDSNLENRIKEHNEAIKSFDSFRIQINRSLMEIEEKVNELRIEVQELDNL